MNTEKQIITWYPLVLKLRIKGLPIGCARTLFESVRPEKYEQELMMRYEHKKIGWTSIGVAYGEINLNQLDTEGQIKLIEKLEKDGWKWSV